MSKGDDMPVEPGSPLDEELDQLVNEAIALLVYQGEATGYYDETRLIARLARECLARLMTE